MARDPPEALPPPEPAPTPDAMEAGRLLFAGPVTFLKGVVALEGLPPADRPEIALAGRSNVGKSSLVNALTSRTTLAKTSNTPGRTQEINFFDLNSRGYLVDMPGYGYAEAPKAKVEAWTRLVFDYLRGRPSLQRVLVLIDARHGLKPKDAEVLDLLDRVAVSYQVVLTKLDKLKPQDMAPCVLATRAALRRRPAAHPALRATSAAEGWGLAELRADLASVPGMTLGRFAPA